MSDPSPRASRLPVASWLDKRLVLGVALVLTSVLVGARALAAADTSQLVWSATHDLAAGTVLADDDLTLSRARLFDVEQPLPGRRQADGLRRDAADQRSRADPRRTRCGARPADPLGARSPCRCSAGHLPPDLRRGQQVDLYVTPDDKAVQRGRAAGPRLVLPALTVADVVRGGGLGASGQDQPVVLTSRRTRCSPWCRRCPRGGSTWCGCPAHDGRLMAIPVLTAVSDAVWEADLVAALEPGDLGVTVVRRCVDLAELLSTAATGTGTGCPPVCRPAPARPRAP